MKLQVKDKDIPLDEFILSVLSPQKKLEASLELAKIAFRDTKLKVKDIQEIVRKIRKKIYEEEKGSS
ncbi:MAG: hypothetical protein J7L26_09595 [Candidatus Aminicenantes bacterium]|nr:hypothetical protein [Candidatus Aminicenantes bacterium]